MDPLTAISLVGNILAFIDLGAKLLQGAKEVHESLSGTTEENQSREILVREMQAFSSKLLAPDDAGFIGKDKQLCKLAEECRALSSKLVGLLEKIKPKDPKSKRGSLWSSVKNKYYEKDRQELEQRLDNCRSQLDLQLNFLTSQDTKASLNELLSSLKVNAAELSILRNGMNQIRQGVEITTLSLETQSQLRQLLCIGEEALTVISQDRILKSLKLEGIHGRFDMVDEAHSKTFRWIFKSDIDSGSESEESKTDTDLDSDEEDLLPSDESGLKSEVETEQSSTHTLDIEHSNTQQLGANNDLSKSLLPESNEGRNEDEMIDDLETEVRQCDRQHKNDEFAKSVLDDKSSVDENEDRSVASSPDQDDSTHGNEIIEDHEEEEIKHLAREKLLNWLSAGEGIFHISGKLGSGKSTLMKFLCTRPETEAELRKWAGHRKLVFVNFFFWKPGTSSQKSLAGLYQGLLYSVLEACPELISLVLPDVWKAMVSSPWQIQTLLDINATEIKNAFKNLIGHTSGKNHCFCFFIDGLDEFEETTQCDYRAMSELLCSWTAGARGNVKCCVSSREYNVFMNMFSSTRRLRLHDLTWRDMKIFIRDKLSHLPNPEDRDQLVSAIIGKAKGIFLWVALVTKSIRDQLENHTTIFEMKKELDNLPDELDGLYEHILQSLTQTNRKRAYRILHMLDITPSYGRKISISAFSYSFMEEYEADPKFAMKDKFVESGMGGMTRNQRIEAARKRLNGCCKGLVESDSYGDVFYYTHRSVAEFLRNPKIQKPSISAIGDFDAFDAISQLLLAELRLRRVADSVDAESILVRRYETQAFLLMRSENRLDQSPYIFLECFDAALDPIPWECLNSGTTHLDFFVDGIMEIVPMIRKIVYTNGPRLQDSLQPNDNYKLQTPLHILTANGYHDYPVWKILHYPSIVDTVTKVTVLTYCSMKQFTDPRPPSDSVLEVLLETGLLAPALNTQTNLGSVWSRQPDGSAKLTVWQHCLVFIFLRYRGWSITVNQISFFGKILEAFLRQDCDLNFGMALKPPSRNARNEHERFAVIRTGTNLSESIEIDVYSWQNQDSFDFPSLRVWIESTELENKDQLLQLYDSRMATTRVEETKNDAISQVDTKDDDTTTNQMDLHTTSLSEQKLEELKQPAPQITEHLSSNPRSSLNSFAHISLLGCVFIAILGIWIFVFRSLFLTV